MANTGRKGLRDLLVKELETLRTQALAVKDGQAAFQYMNRTQIFFKNYSISLINLLKEIDYAQRDKEAGGAATDGEHQGSDQKPTRSDGITS